MQISIRELQALLAGQAELKQLRAEVARLSNENTHLSARVSEAEWWGNALCQALLARAIDRVTIDPAAPSHGAYSRHFNEGGTITLIKTEAQND